jgi:hypothetical protein
VITTSPPPTRRRAAARAGSINALASAALQLPAVVAPVVADVLIAHGLGAVYIGLLIAGSLALFVVALGWVEPQLPAVANGVRSPNRTMEVSGDGRY